MTSGCLEVKSVMFPWTIHSVMVHSGNSFGETPSTGRTFGWDRRLQITISRNNPCHQPSKVRLTQKWQQRTRSILDRPPPVWVRKLFTRTRFPLRWPFRAPLNPPEALSPMSPSFEISESKQERGRMVREKQTARRMRMLFLRRSTSIFGASKACTMDQMGCTNYPRPT